MIALFARLLHETTFEQRWLFALRTESSFQILHVCLPTNHQASDTLHHSGRKCQNSSTPWTKVRRNSVPPSHHLPSPLGLAG